MYGNAQMANRPSALPQLLPISSAQSRVNQQQFTTQQQAGERNYFAVAGQSLTGEGTTTYQDHTSTDEITKTMTATLDANQNQQDQQDFVLGMP